MDPLVATPVRAVFGARLSDGRQVDVAIHAGEIASIEPASARRPSDTSELEMSGCLLLGAPAEPHAPTWTRPDPQRLPVAPAPDLRAL